MQGKQTTGATISRLGVLTVLVNNRLTDNHLDAPTRSRYRREIKTITDGKAGVPREKVIQRSVERCAVGGAMMMSNGVGLWGTN